MPLTVTVGEISAAIRVTANPAVPPDEPVRSIITRYRSVAQTRIDQYAPGADQDTKNEAAIRFIGYLFEAPPLMASPALAFRNSGAQALLAPYRSIVYRLIGDRSSPESLIEPGDTGETVIVPSHPIHPGTHNRFVGWSGDTTIAASDFSGLTPDMDDRLTVPSRSGNAYLWFAVDASVGYPDSLILGANPTNQLPFFQRQSGVVTVSGTSYVVGLNPNLLNASAVAGETITLGFA